MRPWLMAPLLTAVLSVACFGNDLPLVDAAKNGDKQAIRSLLRSGADVNAAEGDGATALAWSAYRDDLEIADLLIQARVNVNAANDYGVTPLSLACGNRSSTFVEKLLQAGANPNATQETGETPLMTCARTGATDAVKLLLARGANPNAKDSRREQTALMWAADGKHSEIVHALLEKGADAKGRSKAGFTPLMFAARSGDLESARMLLAAGADVNATAPEQGNALVIASASGQEAFAIYLLEAGANPNSSDGHGITALHNAVQKGLSALTHVRYDASYRVQPPNMPKLAAALLAKGANPNARIESEDQRGPSDVLFSMVGATPFFLAAVAADAELMRLLVWAGADPHLTGGNQTTPLMAAAGAACAGSCAYQGGNGRPREEDEKQALVAVEVAVEAGADLQAANRDGQTAMHAAAFTGADSIVQFLFEKGAKVNVKDKTGETPWTMAAGVSPVLRDRGTYGSHESTANLLLKMGAVPVSQEELAPQELAPNARPTTNR
jgi:uncharacterized protein